MDTDVPLEHLGDIKVRFHFSLDRDRQRAQGQREALLNFLMTYVDEHGTSVYGQRIGNLGEMNAESFEVFYLHLADSKAITEVKISFCSNCENRGQFQVNSEQMVYCNYQR